MNKYINKVRFVTLEFQEEQIFCKINIVSAIGDV